MLIKLSLQAKKELLETLRDSYQRAAWKDKGRILDGFVAATGYNRKHAVYLLRQSPLAREKQNYHPRRTKYDPAFKQVLLTVWYAANQICSKRLVPFIPELVSSLEKFGHLSLTVSIRQQLFSISAASVDRFLKVERQQTKKGLSTTKPGSLLNVSSGLGYGIL